MSEIFQVLCVVLIIELLPTWSDSKNISQHCKCQTIVVSGFLGVAGTYVSAVLLFKLLVGYSKFSFYQGIVAPGSFGLTSAHDGCLVDAQSAGCCSL